MPPVRNVRRLRGVPLLEGAAEHATSTNWAGYVSATGTYTSVQATWTQPNLTGSTTSSVAYWVGLDGWTGTGANTVEQIGTQTDNNSGVYKHSAWSELFPSGSEWWSPEAYPIFAGDSITASVTYVTTGGGYFELALADTTQGWSYTEYKPLIAVEIAEIGVSSGGNTLTAPFRNTIEVIVEDFTGTLANFGTVTFTGITPVLTAPTAITIVNSNTDATPGAYASNSFTVTWNNYT